jgi:hypothetical protein
MGEPGWGLRALTALNAKVGGTYGGEKYATQFGKAVEILQDSLDPERRSEAVSRIDSPEMKKLVEGLLEHSVYENHPLRQWLVREQPRQDEGYEGTKDTSRARAAEGFARSQELAYGGLVKGDDKDNALKRWLAMQRQGEARDMTSEQSLTPADPDAENAVTQVLRRLLEPQSGAETAGAVGAGFVPGVGEAMDAGEVYLGIADRDPLRAGIGALALAAGPLLSSAGVKAAGSAVMRDKLKLWHGSPHKFDKFEISHMGSGEGYQMAGPGHYLGEARGTGEHYANTLGRLRREMGGEEYMTPIQGHSGSAMTHMDDLDPEEVALAYLDPKYRAYTKAGGARDLTHEEFMQSVEGASAGVDGTIDSARRMSARGVPYEGSFTDTNEFTVGPMTAFLDRGEFPDIPKLRAAREVLGDLTPYDADDFRRGYLYEVGVDAKRSDFLDLNKSLLSTPTGRRFAISSRGVPGTTVSEASAIDIMQALDSFRGPAPQFTHRGLADDVFGEFGAAMEASMAGKGKIPEEVILRARDALRTITENYPEGAMKTNALAALRSLEIDNIPIGSQMSGWIARGLAEGKYGRAGLESLMESQGIRGVRFEDQLSRLAREAQPQLYSGPRTQNFVVSRDEPLSIIRRYAEGGPVGDNVLQQWLAMQR